MRSSNKIQRAFHSCWQRTTVHLRNEIWVLINALYGKRMSWYIHWYVLQKAHSVNKSGNSEWPSLLLAWSRSSMAASRPRHTILHWTLGDHPIPPSTQNNSNHQQNSNSSLSHSPTPPPVLWQWEVWIAEHKPQPLLSSVYLGHIQHPMANSSGWIPHIPQNLSICEWVQAISACEWSISILD